LDLGRERPANGEAEAERRAAAARQFIQNGAVRVDVNVNVSGAHATSTATATASGVATASPPRVHQHAERTVTDTLDLTTGPLGVSSAAAAAPCAAPIALRPFRPPSLADAAEPASGERCTTCWGRWWWTERDAPRRGGGAGVASRRRRRGGDGVRDVTDRLVPRVTPASGIAGRIADRLLDLAADVRRLAPPDHRDPRRSTLQRAALPTSCAGSRMMRSGGWWIDGGKR
jgi:hypothetical protein